jgi:hypothetical protein
VPFVAEAHFFKKLSLKMEKNLQAPQVLLSANVMKSPVLLPVLKVELAGFWDTLNLNNMPQNSENSLLLLFLFVEF